MSSSKSKDLHGFALVMHFLTPFLHVLASLLLVLYYCLEAIVLLLVPKRFRYKDVSGETVLITGGGSGLGRLLAIRFAKIGCRVVIWDVNIQGAKETVQMIKESGGEAFAFECDISKPQNVYEVAAKVRDEVGKVTMLINNAGIVTGKRFLDCPDTMIQKTFEVNVMAHFWMCKAFLPGMIEANHGHIVSIASMAGLAGVVRLSDYCASKFAAVGFEESLRMELHVEGHTGIKSTVVCPYFINTGMFAGARPGIFTMMTPEYVADEIVSAVLINQEVLILPKVFYFLVAIKAILPTNAVREGLGMCSILSPMSAFSGHREQNGHITKKNGVSTIGQNQQNGHSLKNGVSIAGHIHQNGVHRAGHIQQNGASTNGHLQNGHSKQNGHHQHLEPALNGKVKVG